MEVTVFLASAPEPVTTKEGCRRWTNLTLNANKGPTGESLPTFIASCEQDAEDDHHKAIRSGFGDNVLHKPLCPMRPALHIRIITSDE